MSIARYLFLLLAAGCIKPVAAAGQPVVYSFEQIDSLQQKEKRGVLVFIHTDWCKFCRNMEQTTFRDGEVVALLNRQFYFVSLDAEVRRDISFHGSTFQYKPSGANTGLHELARELGTFDGQVSYPTICILNADYEIAFQYNQYLSAAELLAVLKKL